MEFTPSLHQLTTSLLLSGYIMLLCLSKTSTALTGLCGTSEGRSTCFACSELRDLAAAPLDCCGDPYVYSLCHACIFDPSSCDVARSKLTQKAAAQVDLVNANFVRQQRSPAAAKSKGELMQIMSFRPQRRAKYFLGKRDSVSPFLGKRTIDERAHDDLYAVGDKRGANPFLGKRASPFLGKRVSDLINEAAQGYMDQSALAMSSDNQQSKRQNPFLGKRANPFLGKRMSEILNEDAASEASILEAAAKRQNPFLGKRFAQTYGPQFDSPMGFDDMQDFLIDEDSMSKRTSPFLGKRAIGQYATMKHGNSLDNSAATDNVAKVGSSYTRPLARRAKYFLGKRAEGENSSSLSKRSKYFLGKREPAEDDGLMTDEFQNMHDMAAALNVQDGDMTSANGADKRAKYFLGKRDVKEVSSSSEAAAEETPVVALAQ